MIYLPRRSPFILPGGPEFTPPSVCSLMPQRCMMGAAGAKKGVTTLSASGEWSGGTGDWTFPGADLEVSANDSFIYTNDEFTGDFEFTFTHKTDEANISAIGVFAASNKGSVVTTTPTQSFSAWWWNKHDNPGESELVNNGTITFPTTSAFSMSSAVDGDKITFKRVGTTLSLLRNDSTEHTFATTTSADLSALVGQGNTATGHILDVSWTDFA